MGQADRESSSAVQQGSRSRPVKRAQHLEQRGFSTAARTGDGHEFSLDHAKSYTPEGLDPAILESFLEFNDLE
jgi:hypothetical protein